MTAALMSIRGVFSREGWMRLIDRHPGPLVRGCVKTRRGERRRQHVSVAASEIHQHPLHSRRHYLDPQRDALLRRQPAEICCFKLFLGKRRLLLLWGTPYTVYADMSEPLASTPGQQV